MVLTCSSRRLAVGVALGSFGARTFILDCPQVHLDRCFFSHVLPGAISGDIAKGVSLAFKDTAARAGLAASIVADKIIGLTALLLFFDLACAVVYFMYGDAFGELRRLAVIALVLSLIGILATLGVVRVAGRFRSNAAGNPRSLASPCTKR